MLALLSARKALGNAMWPSRLVQVVVPFSPGTGMDTLARSLAPHLSARWGQTIVIDNRPGASGNLGANAVAKSQPDGHTLMVGVSTLVINPVLYANMTYDPLKDLAPVGLCATGSFLLVASVTSKIGSVDELVKRARAKPGALDYASPGIATGPHMAMELFKLQEKISITHIPFSGAAAAVPSKRSRCHRVARFNADAGWQLRQENGVGRDIDAAAIDDHARVFRPRPTQHHTAARN
jgi:tripartite-type tricarboxylate transporter receptor subunit TctC